MKSMSVWARSRTALSMAALLALVACGGGGESTSGGSTPTTVSVSGVASKGLLAHAKVTAYAVNNNGTANESQVLGSAITTDVGSYVIAGLPPSTPVILKVTPLAAEGSRPATTMKDEATGVPVVVPVDSGFSLSAAMVLDATGTTSAQVTPFTDMAAKLAQSQASSAGAGVTVADVIKSANGAVSGALGVLLTDAPTFDSSGRPTNAAAVQLAAVSQMAKDNTGGELTAACPSLSLSTATTLEKVKCAVKALGDDVQTPTAAGAPLLSDALVSHLNTAQDLVVVSPSVTVTTPPMTSGTTTVAVGGESKTAIEAAKALIASVRADATALTNQSDATSLRARVQAVQDASHSVAQPLDDGTLMALNALSEAITAYQNEEPGPFPISGGAGFSNGLGQLVSGCKYFTDADFQTPSKGRTLYLGCRVLQRVGYAGGHPFAVYHSIGLTDTGNGRFTVKSILARAPILDAQSAQPEYGVEEVLSDTRILTVDSGNTLNVAGEFAPGYEASWSYNSATFSYDESIVALGTHQVLAISLTETQVATSIRYDLAGDVRVYQGAAVQSRVSLKTGSYIQEKDVAGPTQTEAATLILEAQLTDGAKFVGTITATDFVQSAASRPTKATLTGYFTDMGGTAKLFDGTLTLGMPTDTGLGWDAALNGTLVSTGAHTMTVNLTAKQSATVKGDGTVTGRYTQGANTFLLTAIDSKTDLTKRQLSLSDATGGVSFVAKPTDTLVDIKKGTTVLGTFNVSNSRLVYADGTYEQF
jgi:hypothetical protein